MQTHQTQSHACTHMQHMCVHTHIHACTHAAHVHTHMHGNALSREYTACTQSVCECVRITKAPVCSESRGWCKGVLMPFWGKPGTSLWRQSKIDTFTHTSMGSKFLLNPWLNLAQKKKKKKPVCSTQLSKHTWLRAGTCTAQLKSEKRSDVHVDLREDETLGSKSGSWGESTDLSSESLSNLQTDYLIN